MACPVLLPGLRVFRRDDQHLQVGLDERRVVLPDTADVRRLLTDLETGTTPAPVSPEAGLALRDLVGRGMVVERTALTAAMSGRASRAATAAVFAAHGPEATARLAARRRCHVAVSAPEPWARRATDWLAAVGVGAPDGARPPTVTLVVTAGEPVRSRIDRLVRDDRPHLLVALLVDRVRVGPFVSPGNTACLRCLDAHLAEQDPRRGLVLEQLEGGPPATAYADPYAPLLAHVGVALAAHDLTAWADGDRPATWSTTVTVGLDADPVRRSWPRHPHCGCSWG